MWNVLYSLPSDFKKWECAQNDQAITVKTYHSPQIYFYLLCWFHNELLITIKHEIFTRLFCLLSELSTLIKYPLDPSFTSGFFCLLTLFQTVLKLLKKICMGKGLCLTSSCGCKIQRRFSDGNLKIQTVLKQQMNRIWVQLVLWFFSQWNGWFSCWTGSSP